ncbi:MAG: ArsB/NhaD family transporter [Candidatus Methanomethylicia archaeon]
MFSVQVIAAFIFVLTWFLMLKRPWNIRLGWASGVGAILSLLFGVIGLGDVLYAFEVVWDAALAFIGILLLSATLNAMGFFKWAAMKIIGFAHGDGVRVYFYIALLTAMVSILFANDTAILILTPIVIEIVRQPHISYEAKVAYVFAAGLIADTAAMPLITSNPVNIVSADFFNYTFLDHLKFMGPVAVPTVLISMFVVYAIFRRHVPKMFLQDFYELLHYPMSSLDLKVIVATLIAIDVGYIYASLHGIPVSMVIFSGAIFLLAYYAFTRRILFTTPKAKIFMREEVKGVVNIFMEVNWDILIFMVGIFLVVQGLRHVGVEEIFAYLLLWGSNLPLILSTVVPSFIVTIGASFMNNWPMTMIGLISIEEALHQCNPSQKLYYNLIFSNVIGNNLGPHFFPFGSLAILMWLEIVRRNGINVRLRDYLKVGGVLSIIEVASASIILWFELNVLQYHL